MYVFVFNSGSKNVKIFLIGSGIKALLVPKKVLINIIGMSTRKFELRLLRAKSKNHFKKRHSKVYT
jgi:hypothetical protein